MFFTKKFDSCVKYSRKNDGINKELKKHCDFLNDIAIGKYSVISETRNLFTEDLGLSGNQKIYESLLTLLSCYRRKFRHDQFKEALSILAPCCKSNMGNL